ncbi:ABC transporter permease [Stackebrandtia nassauensis]|uniref:ABC3 transporter permease C-terminal domain-containing protein n=1 Tax=Stackebrandtia nassauensis (strain DSM 44728 / CIP 108903 / NRRL B-16338 / NBRC 102104 / LLR-40K-21) TaxID=446470 RepID=D3Q750_STANL|nr:ABC transporter permease [Stackebrandtia nassauensis]ADD42321.1 protein of unknown function DUF214 [Stackebrandtia nassauensis DSM 44728]
MLTLAWRTIRGRMGGFVGAFIALLTAAALITGCGILLESGLRSNLPPQRYAGAEVVVAANQSLELPNVPDVSYGDRVRLPADLVPVIENVPGVEAAVADHSVPVSLASGDGVTEIAGRPITGHGWDSASLAPLDLTRGRAPETSDEVVLDSRVAAHADAETGDRLEIAVGSAPRSYTVVGVASRSGGLREPSVFFTPEQAETLSGHPGQVDAIGVIAADGQTAATLAPRVETAVSAHSQDARVFTGADRGSIEFLDIGTAKNTLVAVAGSFGGIAFMVALFIVISTLALQLQQRQRELALLRAIAATPRQLHRLIGAETLLVSATAGILGAGLGVLLSSLLRDAFAGIGLVPTDLPLTIGAVPMLVAVVLCVAAARLAGWVSARKAVRIRPVEALGAAAVQTPRLGRARAVSGVVTLLAGLAMSMLPILVDGDTATGAAAMSVVVLVIAVGLLGPRIAAASIRLLGPVLSRGLGVSGYLAAANTRGNARRLAAAITPLVLAVAIASVQIFTGTTRAAIAADQAETGVRADFVVSGDSGLDPGLAAKIRDLDGASATPLVRQQVRGEHHVGGSKNPTTRVFAAQGLDPNGLADTVNLDVRDGRTDRLRGETVALSLAAADILGTRVGDRVRLHLADGTAIRPKVVAVYGNGLGFGDITLPHRLLLAHTPNGLDESVLVAAEDSADRDRLDTALRHLTGRYVGVTVRTPESVGAAGQDQAATQGLATLLLLAAVFGYIAIGVSNTLVMATSQRRREFSLLRLVGTRRRQVLAMMRVETVVVIAVATVLGSLLALPPLVGVSLGLTERRDAIPAISLPIYLGILAVAALIATASIMLTTRLALRTRPVEGIGIRE